MERTRVLARERAAAARAAREQEEVARLKREREEEAARLVKEREDAVRAAKEQEDAARAAKEREDAARAAKEREDAARAAKEREDAARAAKEREDAARAAKEREDAARLAKQREEAAFLAGQREAAARSAREQVEAARLELEKKRQEEQKARDQEEAIRKTLARQEAEETLSAKFAPVENSLRPDAATQAPALQDEPSWTPGDEPALTPEEQVRLSQEDQPHWAAKDQARWAQEQADAEERRLAAEKASEKARQIVTEQTARFQHQHGQKPAQLSASNIAPQLRSSAPSEVDGTTRDEELSGPVVTRKLRRLDDSMQAPSRVVVPFRIETETGTGMGTANANANEETQLASLPDPELPGEPEELLDDAHFERGQKLLERKVQRMRKQAEALAEQEKLLMAQEKVRRKTRRDPLEFDLGAWLAGAGAADLRECSDSERRKVCAVGYTVLVPTIFSLLSASYAASTLTNNPYVIWIVAFAWATIILLVDRAIIATYSPNMSFFSKAGTILLRFVVATLMGLTVSHPLTLLIFKDTINAQIEEQRDQEITAAREKFTALKKDMEQKVTDAQAEVERQRVLYNQSFEVNSAKPDAGAANPDSSGTLTPEEQVILKQRTEDAAKPFQQELATLEANIQTVEAQRTKLQTELDDWQRQFEAEIGGQRSGVSGIGPRARSIQTDQIEWRRTDFKRLTDEVQNLTARRSEIQKSMTASGQALRREMERVAAERGEKARQDSQRLAGLQQQLQEKKLQTMVSEGDNLRKNIQKAIDSGLDELNRRRRELDDLTALELKRMDDLRNNPRRDMLTQTLAMHHLFEHPDAGGDFALIAYLVLAGLFLAIDTMPILVKFTAKKGEYDERRERAYALAKIPAEARKHDEVDAETLRQLVLEYDMEEQQMRIQEQRAKALEQREKACERQQRVHAKEKEVYQKEQEAMQAKADRDAALTFKTLEIAERERERQRELAEQDRKLAEKERELALAKQEAELEKLELAAKEAEANEAQAKAHLKKLELEVVQNDPRGLLKHQLQEQQVARTRQRFLKRVDEEVLPEPAAEEQKADETPVPVEEVVAAREEDAITMNDEIVIDEMEEGIAEGEEPEAPRTIAEILKAKAVQVDELDEVAEPV